MKIGVEPIAGLANRLRVLDSTLSFAQKHSAEVDIYWRLSPDLNCSFDQLLEKPANCRVIQEERKYFSGGKKEALYNMFSKLFRNGRSKEFEKQFYYNDILRLRKAGFNFDNLSKHESVFIQSYTNLDDNWDSLKLLKPSERVRQRSKEIIDKYFSTNTIGIHIRRGDHTTAIAKSPDALFHEKIEEEIGKSAETTFFMATDSLSTEKQFIERYGDRIITRPKVLDRNSEEGIIDAFTDILCLAATRKIYGSFYSSFSMYAASINNIELCVLQKQE